MFNRVRNAFISAVNGIDSIPNARDGEHVPPAAEKLPLKFKYTRPSFLQFSTDDEVQVSADHAIRPIIVPRDITKIPWSSGYAEAINAGKSLRNEDQAAIHRGIIRRHVKLPIRAAKPAGGVTNGKDEGCSGDVAVSPQSIFATPPSTPDGPIRHAEQIIEQSLPWVYFALFDGHAGSGVAVAASNTLQKIIQEKLMSVIDLLMPLPEEGAVVVDLEGNVLQQRPVAQGAPFGAAAAERVTTDSLIIGALEQAFWEMDHQIARDKHHYKMTGGCTAVIALFIMGKLFVANAGDSRAVLCRCDRDLAIPLSSDFTPESERERVKHLAMVRPDLLGDEFTHNEYWRRPVRADLGKRLLYRDAYMRGWAYKTITVSDLKFPLVYGEGKKSRVLATIGVTRGFGDHDLKAHGGNVCIKPFLTPEPEVRIFDLMSESISASDVLLLGTDGLWDVTSNESALLVVKNSLKHFPPTDTQRYRYRYTTAAQDLVMHARGKLRDRNWRTADDRQATIDDISVFVIPILGYKEEYSAWLKMEEQQQEKYRSKMSPTGSSLTCRYVASGNGFEDDVVMTSLDGDDVDGSATATINNGGAVRGDVCVAADDDDTLRVGQVALRLVNGVSEEMLAPTTDSAMVETETETTSSSNPGSPSQGEKRRSSWQHAPLALVDSPSLPIPKS